MKRQIELGGMPEYYSSIRSTGMKVVVIIFCYLVSFNNIASCKVGSVKGEGIINKIESNSILIDGSAFRLKSSAKVEKKGFHFSVADLRPGWKVQYKTKDGEVISIEVKGIPVVYQYPEHTGLKTSIAIDKVRLGNLSPDVMQRSTDLQSGIESILLGCLQACGKFAVIDLRSREEIVNQIDFSKSDYVNPELAKKSGRQIPADYLVKVHILDFGFESKGGKGIGAMGVKLGKKKTNIDVKMELTIEDISTGTLVKSLYDTLSFYASETSLNVNMAGFVSGLSAFTNDLEKLSVLDKASQSGLECSSESCYESPIGEVFGILCNRLVEKLYYEIDDIPWNSVVVSVTKGKFIIRGGQDRGIKVGDQFKVFRSTPELIDPETGLSLGEIDTMIGTLTVLSVQEKVSTCRFDGKKKPSRGDKCVLTIEKQMSGL